MRKSPRGQSPRLLSSHSLIGHSHRPRRHTPRWVTAVSNGRVGCGRGVHGPRCPPSHLPNLGKAVESGHIPILMLLDAFHGDIDACTTVAVVLMPARPTLEPLFVAVRTLRMSTHRTPLARVLGVNPPGRNPLERRLVRRVVLEGAEREVVQASVHPRAVVDTVAHLFEVFKDDARVLELLAPLHDVTAHLVESVTDEPSFPLSSVSCILGFSAFCTRFLIVK